MIPEATGEIPKATGEIPNATGEIQKATCDIIKMIEINFDKNNTKYISKQQYNSLYDIYDSLRNILK